MDVELRPITAAELSAFTESEVAGFGYRPSTAQLEAARNLTELDRTIAVFDADRIVGTAGAFSFELTVPGPAFVPAAGVTAVTVQPTHRRRGLLSRMMRKQLDDVAERGEPLALLTASEGSIYGRFGYGIAIHYTVLELERVRTRLAAPVEVPGHMVLLDRESPAKVLPPVWDAMRRRVVGQLGRSPAYWGEVLRDGGFFDDSGTRFIVIHERAPGDADGYAIYRIESKPALPGQRPQRFLNVRELVTLDDTVRAALWQFLLGVDLIDTVSAFVPVDEPLKWRLTDPRQARTARLGDHVWARVVDVPAALEARSYGDRGRLVVDVHDAFRPASGGTFELDAGPDGAECRRVTADPDLSLQATDLGSTYLGGVRFSALARAGRIAEHTPGALALADRLFDIDPLPWCDSDF